MRLLPAVPVLALGESTVQVGWDAPLVLEGLAARDARFLRSLEGGRGVGAAERRRHRSLLERLRAHGLTVDDADAPPQRCVRIHGAGALGTEAALALARSQVPVAVVDPARARPGRAAHLPDPSCGAVAHARVRQEVPEACLRGAHADAALDVLISAGPAIARARALLAADQPHLLVECGDRSVRVGPLVVPGVTACATCVGLHRSENRPEWPLLALQSDSRRPRVAPAIATIAGGLIASEALAFLEGRESATWRVDRGGVAREPMLAPHAECRCTGAVDVPDPASSARAR